MTWTPFPGFPAVEAPAQISRTEGGLEISLPVAPNQPTGFSMPSSSVSQAGYLTGLGGWDQANAPILATTIANPSPETLTLEAICLNQRAMLFSERAFAQQYDFSADQLSTMMRLFWQAFPLVHHDSGFVPEPISVYRLQRVYGFGLCTAYNDSLTVPLRRSGIRVRKVPAAGHTTYQYLLDGAWHLFDFDTKSYYLDQRGRVADAAAVEAFPQLVVAQHFTGLTDSWYSRYRAALILQEHGGWGEIMREELPPPDDAPLVLASGDSVTFTSQPSRTHLGTSLSSRPQDPQHLRTGWFELAPIAELSTPELKLTRSLPFPIDQVEISLRPTMADRSGLAIVASIEGTEQPLAWIRGAEGREVTVTGALDPCSEVELALYSKILSDDPSYRVSNIRIRLRFRYNSRLLAHSDVRNLLLLLGDGPTARVRLRVNAEFDNRFFDEAETAQLELLPQGLEISLRPRLQATLFEYFLAADGEDIPLAPALYWADRVGRRSVALDFLPAGRHRLHYRCLYDEGYWSAWKVADPSVEVPEGPTPVLSLRLSQDNGKVRAAVIDESGEIHDRKSVLVLSHNRVFPWRLDQPFPQPSTGLEGGELSFTAPPTFRRQRVTGGEEIELPRWAAYALILDHSGRLASDLIEIRSQLVGQGLRAEPIDPGTTLSIVHTVVRQALDYYTWVEVPDRQRADFQFADPQLQKLFTP